MTMSDHRDITRWLVEQIRAGQPTPTLLRSMCDRGWDRDLAMGLIAQAMRVREASASDPVAAGGVAGGDAGAVIASAADGAVAAGKPMPRVDTTGLYLDAGDRKVPVLMALRDPQVVLFGDFLARDECDRLVEAARPRLQRSKTSDLSTGESMVDDVRTSRGMFFQREETPLVRRIEARIARLLDWPVANGEHLQVLHYRPGDRYEPHYDYFDPQRPGTAALLAHGGQRVATFLMYLREPEQGGDTTFPDLGLRFAPKRGSALYFAYPRADATSRTLHGGAPVTAGEKWVATKWLRERAFG